MKTHLFTSTFNSRLYGRVNVSIRYAGNGRQRSGKCESRPALLTIRDGVGRVYRKCCKICVSSFNFDFENGDGIFVGNFAGAPVYQIHLGGNPWDGPKLYLSEVTCKAVPELTGDDIAD